MTTPDQQGDGPTREELEALTAKELDAQYNPPSGSKADKIDAILANGGQPFPKAEGATITLAVDGLSSDAHYWAEGEDPITVDGTDVPSNKAAEIIAQAASGGVRVFEKEN